MIGNFTLSFILSAKALEEDKVLLTIRGVSLTLVSFYSLFLFTRPIYVIIFIEKNVCNFFAIRNRS